MKNITLICKLASLLLLVMFTGCRTEPSSSPPPPPLANAGEDQYISTGSLVRLNGSLSSSAGNAPISYAWQFVTRPNDSNTKLTNADTVAPSFIADQEGLYRVELTVSDGRLNSQIDTVIIHSTRGNLPPIAAAGPDQNITTGTLVQLDGSASSDADGNPLSYTWDLSSRPSGSNSSLSDIYVANPSFIPDIDGLYTLSLIVNDGLLSSVADAITITASSGITVQDDFAGNGALLGYTVNNPTALPDVTRTNGRYRANLVDNANDQTLHFNNLQGRLDAKLVSFPFDYTARNIGIGTQDDSQIPPAGTNRPYIFAGIQVHVPDLDVRDSSHLVVGHRGGTYFTIEGKNTVNGRSRVDDEGANVAPDGRADIRIVGNVDRTLTVYWQLPNLTGNSANDNWMLYRDRGTLPGTAPAYGDSVYIGLITYAQGTRGLPFVGTCDGIEFSN